MSIEKEISELDEMLAVVKARAARVQKEIDDREKNIKTTTAFLAKGGNKNVDTEHLLSFFKKPYVVIPQGKNKVLVAVPKFVRGFQVGWLWKETDSFFIYQFDQYSAWLGEAPADLLNEIDFKHEFDVTVSGNQISFKPGDREAVKRRLSHLLSEGTIQETGAQIKKGRQFDVLAETIKAGCLPFRATPVSKDDLRPPQAKIKLRDYQTPVIKKFLETGAVGAFHPTGAGKSFIAMHIMDIVKGKKVLFVPNNTLKEQWRAYVDTNIPHVSSELSIYTYNVSSANVAGEYALAIYDECQRLPADTFSRLALLHTKYRLGLSASPHREDGRENYIFALTGFPVGVNWQEYMEVAGKEYHPIYVHTVRSKEGKIRKVAELLDEKKKTLIFCDSIELGKEISRRFGVPYVYGDSQNRMQTIAENRVVAVSRVADMGVSTKDLQRIIEVDFLFGSREQELQRTGRLMHSDEAERHDIIMTEQELERHGKRLWALQEKGFTVKVVIL